MSDNLPKVHTWYLDTSVLLRALLGESPSALTWLNSALARGDQFYSSYLIETETLRTLHNLHITGGGADLPDTSGARSWLDRVNRVDVTKAILDDAARLAATIRTADAIHLATAAALGSTMPVLTHDAQMAKAALALGAHPLHPRQFTVRDPVDDDPGSPPVAAAPGTPESPVQTDPGEDA